jgi:hypothetical protein
MDKINQTHQNDSTSNAISKPANDSSKQIEPGKSTQTNSRL